MGKAQTHSYESLMLWDKAIFYIKGYDIEHCNDITV